MKWMTLLALALVAAAAQGQEATGFGTAIIGEQEAAIGLFITPWGEDEASNIDRPPRLFEVPLEPLDPAAFGNQVRAWQRIGDARRSRLSR